MSQEERMSPETFPSSPTAVTSGAPAEAHAGKSVLEITDVEGVTIAVAACAQWFQEMRRFELQLPQAPLTPERLKELREILATDRDALTPEMIAEGQALKAEHARAINDWTTQRDASMDGWVAEHPAPAITMEWGTTGGRSDFQEFALAMHRKGLSDLLMAETKLGLAATQLWVLLNSKDGVNSRTGKPTIEDMVRILEEHQIQIEDDSTPATEAGPAPDAALAEKVWSVILKVYERTARPVTHEAIYERVTARQAAVREATQWLHASGKIVKDPRGWLPHPEDRPDA
jgi:hypothetical protein